MQRFGELVQQLVEEGEAKRVVGGDGAEHAPLREAVVRGREAALRRVLREDGLGRRAEVATPPEWGYLEFNVFMQNII